MAERRPLRLKHKEITDKAEIEDIIRRSGVCRIAMCSGGEPYVVPMNFGYRDNTLYLHSFRQGMKIDCLRENNSVCVEFDVDAVPWPADKICEWGFRYRSVIAFGKAEFIEDRGEKRRAFDVIIEHYTDMEYTIEDKDLDSTLIIKIDLEHVTGKKAGY